MRCEINLRELVTVRNCDGMAIDFESLNASQRFEISCIVFAEWVELADTDYVCARMLYFKDFYRQSLFLAAQALEKYTKAIDICQGERVKRDHDCADRASRYVQDILGEKYIEFTLGQIIGHERRRETILEGLKYIGELGNTSVRYQKPYSVKLDFLPKLDALAFVLRQAFLEKQYQLFRDAHADSLSCDGENDFVLESYDIEGVLRGSDAKLWLRKENTAFYPSENVGTHRTMKYSRSGIAKVKDFKVLRYLEGIERNSKKTKR